MRVGYVCVNWNSSHRTELAVRSLPEDGSVTTVVVDNASPDLGERDALAKLAVSGKNVHIVESPVNRGYFGGLDTGIEYLLSLRSDWDVVIIGNNDLLFPEDFMARLPRYQDLLLRYPVVSPAIVDSEGNHENPHSLRPARRLRKLVWAVYYANYTCAKIVTAVTALLGNRMRRPEKTGRHKFHLEAGPIELGYGAAFVIGPRFFESVGRLPVVTFMYQEEFFLAEAVRMRGFAIYYDPALVVRHQGQGTVGLVPDKIRWQFARDAYLLYRRYESRAPSQRLEMLSGRSTQGSMDPRSGGSERSSF